MVSLSAKQILLFIFCLVRFYYFNHSLKFFLKLAGVLALVGFFTYAIGPYNIVVQVLVLILAIIGCIGAWLAHRILLFFTAIGFIVIACLTIISLILCIVNNCGIAGFIINALLLALFVAIIILSVYIRGKTLAW